MKIVVIIQARMGSTRLPNKVLLPLLDKPLLYWLLHRVSRSVFVDQIIVATTDQAQDDVIAKLVESLGYTVYRGSEQDVLDRYYRAACLVKPDAVVRITADCPLLDPQILDSMIQNFFEAELDFLSNSEPLPSSWPDGMDISICSFNALKRAWQESVKPSEREHVTFYFWNNLSKFKCHRVDHSPDLSKYRLTIDYPEDYDLLKAIVKHFNAIDSQSVLDISMGQIITFLDQSPAILNLNKKFTRGLGWVAALERDKQLGL